MRKPKIEELLCRYFNSIQWFFFFIEVIVLILKPFDDFTEIIAAEEVLIFLRTLKVMIE